jgi:uncharacterized protein (UPF0218 family)
LLSGTEIDLARVLGKIIHEEEPARVILVGDSVSRQASQAGLKPDVMVIDNREKRRKAVEYAYPRGRVLRAKNRPGTIGQEAREAVERAVRGEANLVEIDGEEDLLVIIAVIAAPNRSLVVYGQPNEGIVLVRVSDERRAEAERILGQMRLVE